MVRQVLPQEAARDDVVDGDAPMALVTEEDEVVVDVASSLSARQDVVKL